MRHLIGIILAVAGGTPAPGWYFRSFGRSSRAIRLWMVHSAWLMVKTWEHAKVRTVSGSRLWRGSWPYRRTAVLRG
jgi:hypothetical protein